MANAESRGRVPRVDRAALGIAPGAGGRVRRSRVAAAALLAIAFLAIGFVFRAPLLRAGIAAALDLGTGYFVAFEGLDVGRDRALVLGLHVTSGADPVFDAERVDVRYDLRDLWPGGARRYGLRSILLVRPRLALVRHADGGFNVAVPAPAGPAAGGAAAGPGTPLRFEARVRDGSVTLHDPNRILPTARRLSLDRLDGTLHYDDAGRTTYRVSGVVAGDAAQRFGMAGRIDRSGFAVHRLQAATVQIAPVADYFINSPSARFERGRLDGLDLRAYAFAPAAGGAAAYHVSGSGELADGAMAVPGIVPLATGLRGRVDLIDGGVVAPDLRATLGPLDVRLAGGVYDWHAPALRLGIVAAAAPLARVRGLFAFSRDLPIGGDVRLATLVEGPVGAPVVAARVTVSGASYAGIPVERAAARAFYYDSAVDVVGARGAYGALDVGATGAIVLGDAVRTQLLVDVRGAADGLPFAAQAVPGARVHASAVLAGDGLRLDARGVADGSGGGATLAAVFHLDPDGDGEFGPLEVRRTDGASLVGGYYSNRSSSESGFWLDAHRYPLALASAEPHLPGLSLAPPPFSGRFDGSVAGEGPPSRFRLAGHLHGTDVRAGKVAIDDVTGDLLGAFGDLRSGSVVARGPWGTFGGRAAYADRRLALDGDYRGSFAQLRSLTGELGGEGPVAGRVAVLIDPLRTVVQARDDATGGASVRGVPVDRVSGTVALEDDRLRVYAATAAVAGATLAAAGTLGARSGIGVSVADADAARLRGAAGLVAGRVSAIGAVDDPGAVPRFRGGLALGGTAAGRLAVSGNGDVSLAASRLDLQAADTLVGGAFGSLSGSLRGVGSSRPEYDVDLHLAPTRIAPFVLALAPWRSDLMGTLMGDLHVGGSLGHLSVDGRLAVPEGTVNGLAFSDASAHVRLDPQGLFVRGGRVTVGSTQASFGARYGDGEAAFLIDAPRADLADFNDYFDAGDTLGGRGRIAGRFVKRRQGIETSGDIAIASLRYRRFDLGDARAKWTSRGPAATGSLSFGGPSGRVAADGSVSFPANTRISKLLGRARFRGDAHVRALDLGVWLPALGYQFPILGRVDADADVTGPLGNPFVVTQAKLEGGSLGRFPVDTLTVAATSTVKRTTVTRAVLELPALSVEGSGSFGLGPRDPLQLALHAKSENVGSFADRLFGATYPVTGAAEADVHVDGTRERPRVAGGVDVEHMVLRGVSVPQALGQFTVAGRDVVLSGVEIGFAKGALYLAGSVPIQVAPFNFGPARAPIALDMSVKGVDLAGFSSLLPNGSALAGQLDGRVAVDGTAGAPQLDGALALSGGSIRTPQEAVPLSALSAKLSFDGNAAKLESLHAVAGGGTLDAEGSATLSNLVHPGADAAYRLDARAAALRLDFPALGSGTVDGRLSLTHAPAAPPALAGQLTFSDATIPFSALLLAAGGAGFEGAAAQQPVTVPGAGDLALDLDVSAQRNVRVRSPNVDIGARGDLHVAGTRAAPVLTGVFNSTGGTLTYFNTVFRLVDGTVTFEPDLGVIPTLEARATTHVIDPDPNTVRNASGAADITLAVSGPVSNLSIGLTSDPSYDRQQILGLLLNAPALGAKNLFGDTRGVPTLLGSTETTPLSASLAASRNPSAQVSVAQEAFGVANAQFTRTLLAPFESTVASAVGLTNLNVNVGYTGSVGVTARKILGKNVDAIYGTTFGYPYRQTFGFDIKGSNSTAAQVTVFETLGGTGLDSLSPSTYLYTSNPKLQAAQPNAGSAGFSLSLQRLFW